MDYVGGSVNLKNITENEILGLHKESEGEQIRFLSSIGILMNNTCAFDDHYVHDESLAVCAFRMRDNQFSTNYKKLCLAMGNVYFLMHNVNVRESFFWMFEARPIHWIQAALLAMKRSEA